MGSKWTKLSGFFQWIIGSVSLRNIFWINSNKVSQRLKIILLREAINSTYSTNFINAPEGLAHSAFRGSLHQIITESKPKLAILERLFVSKSTKISESFESKEITLISNTSDFTTLLSEFICREPGRNVTVVNLGFIKRADPNRIFSKALLKAQSFEFELTQLFEVGGWKTVLQNADTWLVDWCLDNAVIFSNLKPSGKKMIIRIHRYDAFSWYPHLVDWSRVNGLIFVSKTIQLIFYEIHGWKVAGIPYVLARNAEISQFNIGVPKLKTLGLLQYNSQVKDPLFALALLKYFRERDSNWKLFVAGPSWNGGQTIKLEKDFFEYIQKNSLGDSVIIEGYQKNPLEWYEKIGFMLSTSLAEGSHEVIRESIAAGAVPLIRNWPSISEFGGAFGAYPELDEFIFETEAQAYKIATANLLREKSLTFMEDQQMTINNIEYLLKQSHP